MKQRIILFLLIFTAFTSMGLQAQPGNKADRKASKAALKKAKEHLGYEEYQQAIPNIIMLLEDDPSNAFYNFWMGKSLYLTYKKNQALPYFEKVGRINPDVDNEFHLYFALTLHYNLEYQRAIDEYRKELDRHEPGTDPYTEVTNRIAQCKYAQQAKGRKEGELVKIRNLGESINTEYAEHSPVISANDSVLLFTARRPECLGARPEQYFYDEDIYISRRGSDGEWGEAKNISTPVNSKGHDATISLTADGKTLYIYRHKKAGGLYVTDFDESDQSWKEPRAMEKPLNSKYYEASICRSADDQIMFFTSDRPGGYGGKDIYMVRRSGKDSWEDPQNLGPMINTPFDEDSPYFHPDNKTLYYSSNGPNSLGGYDIFVTEWDSTMEGWLDPLNMGPPINTPDDEIYFVLSQDGLSGYYASGKEGGFGEKDIYHIKFPYFRYPKRYYVVEVVGVVQDVQSLDTIPAVVRLVDTETGELIDSVVADAETGIYRFELEPERAYTMEVDAEGYPSTIDSLVAPSLAGEDILFHKDFLVDRPGPVITATPKVEMPSLMHLYYDFDKSELRGEAREELDLVVALLKENPDFSVKVLAHTDWYGDYDYNVKLSERRAQAAYQYLIRKGLKASQIEVDHFSEIKPIETNENDTGRQYNRRSEVRILNGDGELIASSLRVKPGASAPFVDHTPPKGKPGFDGPQPVLSGSSPITMGDDDTGQPTGKDALKDDSEPTGKDVLKDGSVSDDGAAIKTATVNGEAVHHIYFDFDRYGLREASKTELQRVYRILEENPDLNVIIAGHTDSHGTTGYNQQLSENRTLSAVMYLEGLGISSSRINSDGYSELQPIKDNSSANGRQMNRRVEFVFVRGGEPVLQSTP